MIGSLKSLIRKIPFIYNILMAIYSKFIWPFVSGHASRMKNYYFNDKKNDINNLTSYGFKNPKPYLDRQWRFGGGKDHAYRRYYTAKFNNKNVFIKVAKNDATIENEIIMANFMQDFSFDFIIPVVAAEEKFGADMKMLATEFTVGLHSFALPETLEEFDNYCKEFLTILDEFQNKKIVHADIHPNNLVLTENNNLCVIDFGISSVIDKTNKVDYSARPGTYYIKTDFGRIYDDAYSFIKMVELLNPSKEMLSSPYFCNIKEKIGTNILKINL